MKKKLFLGLAALAAVALTSCQKDQVINQVPQEQPIEFGTYLGRDAMTKGEITDNKNLPTKKFGVFAYYTGTTNFTTSNKPNFMYNQEVAGNRDASKVTWSYSPVKYWPNKADEKISFFAYSPYTLANPTPSNNIISHSANNAQGTPTLNFKVSTTVTEQTDLLWATPLLNKTKAENNIDSLKFTFNHALSRIGFKVVALADVVNVDNDGTNDVATHTSYLGTETTIIVESVKLSGDFNTVGLLKYTYDDPSSNYKAAIEATDATESTSFTLNNNLTSTSDTEYGNFTNIADKVTTTATQLNNENSYLMIIPQDFTSTDKLTLEVIYHVVTSDSKLDGGSFSYKNTITTQPFNMAGAFEAGKAYNLVLHIGLTSVKLAVESINGWTDASPLDYSVNIPVNVAPQNP